MPNSASCAPGPMPESIRSFGDSMAPAQTITSCWHDAKAFAPPLTYSTPVQRRPSKRSRVACASVRRVRLGRPRAGAR